MSYTSDHIYSSSSIMHPLALDAADEIEELEKQLAEAEAEAVRQKKYVKVNAREIERLATEVAKLRQHLAAMCEEFRGHDLPYGSKVYTAAITLLNSHKEGL